MTEFCGLEKCSLDGSGRLKLPARYLRDFKNHHSLDVVLHCLPEGALAIYPPENWKSIRREEEQRQNPGQSLLRRRQMRMMGAMTQCESISNQGRLTLPAMMRQLCHLDGESEVVLIGCEIGIEIWSVKAWEAELEVMRNHSLNKGANEMDFDLGANYEN